MRKWIGILAGAGLLAVSVAEENTQLKPAQPLYDAIGPAR